MSKTTIKFEIKGYGWKSYLELPKEQVLKSYEQYRQEQIVYHGIKVTIRQFLVQQLAYIVFQGTSSILGIRMEQKSSN